MAFLIFLRFFDHAKWDLKVYLIATNLSNGILYRLETRRGVSKDYVYACVIYRWDIIFLSFTKFAGPFYKKKKRLVFDEPNKSSRNR